jgi:putative transposase
MLDVARSSYYAWRDRTETPTAARRRELAGHVRRVFDDSRQTFGCRRIAAQLNREGIECSVGLVADLMRELGLKAVQPRGYKKTTIPGEGPVSSPDLIGRDFDPASSGPGERLVGDITYLRTDQGWLYLATVIDCFNREVVGYAMADHMRTSLISEAVQMAARNHFLARGCIFHSDRGSQYTSAEFAATLADLDMRGSVGRTGICFDNALAESFNAALKVERGHRTVYPTRQKARQDIARYIEIFYNRRRIHSRLGYKTPHEVRTEYLNRQIAA